MISNKGFLENYITLNAAAADVGKLVSISANNTCSASDEGDAFCGILANERNGIGSVQVTGYAEVTYSGTAPALGQAVVAADDAGGIKTATAGRTVTVLSIDTTNKIAAIIM